MTDFLYDPSTGERSTSVLAPGERLAPAGGQVTPPAEPYEKGDGSPSTGPTAPNVIATPGPFSRTKQG